MFLVEYDGDIDDHFLAKLHCSRLEGSTQKKKCWCVPDATVEQEDNGFSFTGIERITIHSKTMTGYVVGYVLFFGFKIRIDSLVDFNTFHFVPGQTFRFVVFLDDNAEDAARQMYNGFFGFATPGITEGSFNEAPKSFNGTNPNSRDLFPKLFERLPNGGILDEQYLVIRIKTHHPFSKTYLNDTSINELLDLLGFDNDTVVYRNIKGKKNSGQIIARTIDHAFWRDTVELHVNMENRNHSFFTQQEYYSLTAVGFRNYCGHQVKVERLFPFSLVLDGEIWGDNRMNGFVRGHAVYLGPNFKPFIKVQNQSIEQEINCHRELDTNAQIGLDWRVCNPGNVFNHI